ncbi:hypothetical protein ACFL9T_13175 [Thermodesulfobacteriota bacterium]
MGRKKRFFMSRGALGAVVRAGSLNGSENSESGDCIMLDFNHRFIAVADSSDRYPAASRNFLQNFALMLDAFTDFDPQVTYSAEVFQKIKSDLTQRAEELLTEVSFSESSTFTGMLMVSTNEGLKGIILHTGDSLLYRYTGCNLEQISKSNFWMVGRTRHFYQVGEVDIPNGTAFLMATDGFSNLALPEIPGRDECIINLIRDYDIEDVPRVLLEKYDSGLKPMDDIGLILFRPENLPLSKKREIIGGTFL